MFLEEWEHARKELLFLKKQSYGLVGGLGWSSAGKAGAGCWGQLVANQDSSTCDSRPSPGLEP